MIAVNNHYNYYCYDYDYDYDYYVQFVEIFTKKCFAIKNKQLKKYNTQIVNINKNSLEKCLSIVKTIFCQVGSMCFTKFTFTFFLFLVCLEIETSIAKF